MDADPDSADELSRSIANWGHEVRWICDSTAALRLALDHRAEVALLDVSLTEMCAYAAAHALRSEPGLRGCFLLALRWHTDRRRDPQFQPTDVDLYLAKPVDLLVLETVLALEADRLSR
ncbi:MAG TPA: hypothetical protein VFV87_12180 [Pirellulaceae bacterium]|nr:hypothetical protein [Pirellulaceae bacterium]